MKPHWAASQPRRLQRIFPFLLWLGELRDTKVLRADLLAGITVALVLVPQAMAYAQLAGLPPQIGLYAAFLPPIIAALFGSSRQLATGPVALASILTLKALEAFDGQDKLVLAIQLALMVGLIRVFLGISRLGFLVNFISHPVTCGFTAAAALIIACSQLDKFLGVKIETGGSQLETLWRTFSAAKENPHWLTLGFAFGSLAIIVILRRINPLIPGILIACVTATLISWCLGFAESTVAVSPVVGEIPKGLPSLSVPVWNWDATTRLLTPAIVLTLVGFMEAVAIAQSMAVKTRTRFSANQELIGQGLANIVGAFSQSYIVSGSFSRSAVNLRSGAITGFSSVVTGLTVGATLLWFTPLLYHLPQAVLAAVIMSSVLGLIHVKPIIRAWKIHPHEGLTAVAAFALTLVFAPKIENGIVCAALLAIVFHLYRTMKPRVAFLSRHPNGTLNDAETHGLEICPNIAIVRLDRSLCFVNAAYFEGKLLKKYAAAADLKVLIVDGEGMNSLDATGEEVLRELTRRFRDNGVKVLFSRLKFPVLEMLRKTGFVHEFGPKCVFSETEEALKHAWTMLDAGHEATCPLRVR